MSLLNRRPWAAIMCLAAALALMLTATAPATWALNLDLEDCRGTCPEPEGEDVSNPGPEASEPDSGSEGGAQSDPPGDSEPDTNPETDQTG